jgi:UDP-glucose 4-epimerase
MVGQRLERGTSGDTMAPSLHNVRCLVLGAGGFLGAALSSALLDRDAIVHGYGRPPRDRRDSDARLFRSDAEFSDVPALARALDGQDIVFHVLGPSNSAASNAHTTVDFRAHVCRTAKLLDLCRSAKVRKVVFASSGGAVYGIPRKVPTPEWASTEPISAYGINCLAIEHLLARYRDRYGLDYQVLRIGNAYGPRQSPFRSQGVVAVTLHHALSGQALEIWGTGATTRDFLHVDDAMSALVNVAQYSGQHRVMNVGSGEGRSLDELVDDVKRLLDVPEARVIRRPCRSGDVPVSILDTSVIKSETSWRPRVRWFDGLMQTAQWLRARYGL